MGFNGAGQLGDQDPVAHCSAIPLLRLDISECQFSQVEVAALQDEIAFQDAKLLVVQQVQFK